MLQQISEHEILKRLHADNPWWKDRTNIRWKESPKRVCLDPFYKLVRSENVNRAVVLMGQRRVGKTVMIHQAIAKLINEGVKPDHILYVAIDNPIYSGLSLEKILLIFVELNSIKKNERNYLFFDEIQYLRDWERHLKSLVDSYPQHRFIATGSATAALKLKSGESGAGRFTDFILPPLTFYEYILFNERKDLSAWAKDYLNSSKIHPKIEDIIEDINKEFVNYLNFGGYPEAIFSEEIREDPGRFIRNDIIDKVLLRDMPSLYGIKDILELNNLLKNLVFNTGQEIDLSGLSQNSNVTKGTISRYLEYLEAAFLVKRIHRVDKNAKRFKREHKFKVYIVNPSMYSALFGEVGRDDKTVLGKLVETAVFSHFFHIIERPYYARWKSGGEVDMVLMDETEIKPMAAIEIKWSDRPFKNLSEIKGLTDFGTKHKLTDRGTLVCHTLSKSGRRVYNNKTVHFFPVSLVCLALGQVLGQILTSGEFTMPLTGQ